MFGDRDVGVDAEVDSLVEFRQASSLLLHVRAKTRRLVPLVTLGDRAHDRLLPGDRSGNEDEIGIAEAQGFQASNEVVFLALRNGVCRIRGREEVFGGDEKEEEGRLFIDERFRMQHEILAELESNFARSSPSTPAYCLS